MTTIERSGAPAIDLEPVVAPFRDLADTVGLAIEDRDGISIAGNTSGPPPADAHAHLISAGPLAGGRVLAWGPGAVVLGHALAGSLAAALEVAALGDAEWHARETEATHRIEDELAHGRRLQRSFVSLEPPAVPGFDIAAHYEAAREVGGDFFELFRLRRRGRPVSIVIADVTGKGIAAALLMAFSRPLLHAAIDHTKGPAEALERINRILVEERRSSLFITALVARLDPTNGHLCVANAGHEPPLLIRADGSPIDFLVGSGPLVGAFARLDVPEVSVDLGPGDLVLLYTDGVTDARSPEGERFDEWRLLDTIEAVREAPAQEIVTAIADTVCAFQEPADPADDITIVAIRRLPGA
jgi:serine phosphatase RsbU (regulator of sigma subunit)